jgi:DNA-binding LacI/PurR family transcriptional regulator
VTTQPLHEAPHNTLFTMDELRRHLHDAGFALEIHADVRLRSPYAPRLLEQSVRQTQAACWIVSYSPAPVQRWFAERGAPAVVMGSRHEGVELPAIDFDHEAICHHAGGQFARLGHERVAFLRPEVGGAGALASDRGFLDGFRAARPTAPSPQILRYGAGVPSMQTALDELFRPTTAPTGLFVHRALDALTVVSYLGHRGLRIPKDVSLVLGQHDPIVDCLIPSIASYRGDIRKYAARLSRMVLQLARTGESPTRQVFLLAEFKPGESLGPRSR